MTTDIAMAFAHPEERARATSEGPRDRISLRDHIASADIGAFQDERGAPQRLRFNIVVELAQGAAGAGDDVDRILSYDRLTEAVAVELAADRLNLLETLAENVAGRILAAPQAARVFVRVEKIDRGPGALGVEIVRARAERPAVAVPKALRAQVVYLGNDEIDGAGLEAQIAAFRARAVAVVLAVGFPPGARPQAEGQGSPDAGAAQRRIDLLAIEQNAWRLAARVPGLNVVGTRTEIDWAIRSRKVVVWAPAKLVLDAPDGPKAVAIDPGALAGWLAGELSGAGVE